MGRYCYQLVYKNKATNKGVVPITLKVRTRILAQPITSTQKPIRTTQEPITDYTKTIHTSVFHNGHFEELLHV